MKKIALSIALSLSMTGAVAAETKRAANLTKDQLHRDMIVSSQSAELTTTSSGAALLIPLMLVLIVAAAVSSGGGSGYHPYHP